MFYLDTLMLKSLPYVKQLERYFGIDSSHPVVGWFLDYPACTITTPDHPCLGDYTRQSISGPTHGEVTLPPSHHHGVSQPQAGESPHCAGHTSLQLSHDSSDHGRSTIICYISTQPPHCDSHCTVPLGDTLPHRAEVQC